MDRGLQNAVIAAVAGAGAIAAGRYMMRAARARPMCGRSVLITGGSRGLGLVLARQAAERGARVAVCARDESELWACRAEFAYMGRDFFAVPCDLTQPEQITEMVDRVAEEFGGIDFLINNAGVIQVGPLSAMTLNDFRAAMEIHFWAPLHTILATLPHMRNAGRGRIVNITSIGGKIAVPHLLPYCASKFALVGLSEGLRTELRRENILVTTVVPGLMRTGSPRHAWFKGDAEREYAWFITADSLPPLAMSASRAAGKILDAAVHGDAEVTLTLAAKLAVKVQALFPEAVAEINALAERLLPRGGGGGMVEGKDAESAYTRSAVTVLTRRAAEANHENVQ